MNHKTDMETEASRLISCFDDVFILDYLLLLVG